MEQIYVFQRFNYLLQMCKKQKLEIKKIENCVNTSENFAIFYKKMDDLLKENKTSEDFSVEKLNEIMKLCVYKFAKISEFCEKNKLNIEDVDKCYDYSSTCIDVFFIKLNLLLKIKK